MGIAKSTGTIKSFDGTEIYYETHGSGEPIVFIYGLACLMNHWHFQVDYFSQKYQVITFDIRGHHKSVTKDFNNINLESVAKDIDILLSELKVKKAHFVGHSFGAQIILKAYDLFPQYFKTISFINGFASNPIKGMFGLDVIEPLFYFVKAQFEKAPITWNMLWKNAINNPVSMFLSAMAGGFNWKLTQFKDIEVYAKGVSQIPLEVFIPYFEDLMTFEGAEVARKISVPTMVISGEKDSVTPKKFQSELSDLIKDSLFFEAPYGSHCTQLDFPDYINLKLEKFLSNL